jgi:cytochrome P450
MPDIVPSEFFVKPGHDPHSLGAELRARCPVHKIDYPPGAEAYVVVDYETNEKAFTDPRLSKELHNAPAWFRERTLASSPVLASSMVLADPPEHNRLRRLVSRAFLPRRMERLRPRVQQIADDLVDAFPESGEIDLLTEFAYPLPLSTLSVLFGVPQEDTSKFMRWGRGLAESPSNQSDEVQRQRRAVNDEITEYLAKVLADRRATRDQPREDLFSDLVRAADEDAMFTDDELVATMIQLILAGHKTTASLIGNGTAVLLRHPDVLAALRADLGLVPSAVEEFLRYEGSVDRGSLRVAAEDMTLGGVHIPKESFVHLSVSSANRDPAVFPDPDRLDITRTPNRHFGFGHGIHFCAGAPLARLEAGIAFTTLLRRIPHLELGIPFEELSWFADTSIARGLEALPVRFERRLPR